MTEDGGRHHVSGHGDVVDKLYLLIPNRLPHFKIGQSQTVPGHTALVDVLQGLQHHFNEDLHGGVKSLSLTNL